MELDLAFIWTAIIGLAVLLYVILDGFDLGVGILFPLGRDDKQRDVMMNAIAPVWDGNETWLILGGGGLFAVFPLAYGVILSALYVPIIVMLLALIFRGVAFEYRWRTVRWKKVWDAAFFGGSLVAALCQGIALGALVQGIPVADRAYAGGWFDWLTPFSLLTGVAVVTGYALLGAAVLIYKTEGELQERMRRYAFRLGIATLAFMGLVSLITPLLQPVYFSRWFSLPGSLWTMVVPAFMLVLTWLFFTGLRDGRELQPFLAALGFFVAGFMGIGISFYPYMVPPALTIWDAAAPRETLRFALIGTVVLLPLILAYTAYAYWVFRGKVREDEGYH